MKYKLVYILLNIILALMLRPAMAEIATEPLHATIAVRADLPPIGRVNPLIFGHNLESGTPNMKQVKETDAYSNFGGGMWDPIERRPQKRAVEMAKQAGMTAARFPGGGIANKWDWKLSVGNPKKRPRTQFGVDEFLATCMVIGCQPIITFNYFKGPDDAADLVEYLNAPNNGSNPRNGIDWAAIRAANGHKEPYGVQFFEIGNEMYHPIFSITPEDYAHKALEFIAACRQICPNIKLGVVGVHNQEWNRKVLGLTGSKIDFIIVHTYFPGWWDEPEPKLDQETYYNYLLASAPQIESFYKELAAIIDKATARPGQVGIAVTEYNSGYSHNEPIIYRHTLGSALYIADLLRIFIQPENRIIMANYWQFINEWWGSVYGPIYSYDKGPLVKRPQYYPFELYANYFQPILLGLEVNSPTYAIKQYQYLKEAGDDTASNKPIFPAVPYVTATASRSEDEKLICIMVINKHPTDNISATLSIPGHRLSCSFQMFSLNGPSLSSDNEENAGKVTVVPTESITGTLPFTVTLPAHSFSAVLVRPLSRQIPVIRNN